MEELIKFKSWQIHSHKNEFWTAALPKFSKEKNVLIAKFQIFLKSIKKWWLQNYNIFFKRKFALQTSDFRLVSISFIFRMKSACQVEMRVCYRQQKKAKSEEEEGRHLSQPLVFLHSSSSIRSQDIHSQSSSFSTVFSN